ncbi:UDP-N-acetylmuramate dehydrogenase [Fulvivirga lutea]|uniref:UDP-N-acetylenolpyruvoylglucosamine reductase n=1 Tax=Fulvivirga lutea TaxID=2810512 RepID=A0A975A066_9BACT|nr:UDP-N-acetylmuramate dehydrogenase [Fulvivirga lutea]QSE96880.1 UDP-N-acetylmuramate dehydrogenase [Fulvivirga lutea]
MEIIKEASLKSYNTFGLEAKAKFFQEVKSEEALKNVLQNNQEELLILGGGSNILLTKDFDGLVLKNSIEGIDVIKESDDYVIVKVGAGVIWHDFVLYAIEKNWGGIENLSLIPGTVGAAPMQNIGAYGVEIKEVFESLEAIHIKTLDKKVFLKDECEFGYRESVFKHTAKGQYIITSVTFKLTKKEHTLNTSYGAIKEILNQNGISHPTIKDVSDAVIQIRQSKLPDPKKIGNAGSFFKNPTIDKLDYEMLKLEYQDIPGYVVSENEVKVPAGWLIEKCGWKGEKRGNIGVHKNQALVLVNYGNGSGDEIKQLAIDIRESVISKFGIHLMPEVNFI